MSNKNILYYKYYNSCFYILAIGNATAQNYIRTKDKFENLRKNKKEIEKIYVNLEKCIYMDSTFMGILVGFNSYLIENKKEPLLITKVSKKALDLLEEMGISKLFRYDEKNVEFPESMQESSDGNDILVEDVLLAHQDLSNVSLENKNKFQTLIDLLKKQKKKD